MRRERRFGTGIVWGTIPSGFLVFWLPVSRFSRNGYVTSPNLWVQKKFIKPRQSTQNRWLRPAELFWKFLATLPAISSETWEMYSWAISGSSVFCDWLFLVFSSVSLETAANFLLFLKFAMILREKFCQLWKLNWRFCFYNSSVDLLSVLGKRFNEDKTVNDFDKRYNTKRQQIYIITTALSFLLFVPFPWRET